jgi:hypothetical protein
MFGIKDPWIILAYVLSIISAFACIVYGIRNWNKGAENESSEVIEEVKWEKDENEIIDNI